MNPFSIIISSIIIRNCPSNL